VTDDIYTLYPKFESVL